MTALDCLVVGCRWGNAGADRCECVGTLTPADVAVMKFAAAATAEETDFSEFYIDDEGVRS